MMTKERVPELSENHKRAISAALGTLDKDLCEAEMFCKGREIHSIFYNERNNLSLRQRKNILVEIARIREILQELKNGLALESDVRDISKRILGSNAILWADLIETEEKSLRRYGKTPSGFADYLDPRIEKLLGHLETISAIAHVSEGIEPQSGI